MANKKPSVSGQIDIATMRVIFGKNTAAMVDFIKNFIKSTLEILNDVVNAIQAKNGKGAMDCLHRMKGPVGSCRFTRLYTLCEQAEEKVLLEDWSAAEKRCQDIETSLNLLQSELKKNSLIVLKVFLLP